MGSPVRLADAAAVRGKLGALDHVVHLVAVRDGQPPARGERLVTLALPPAEVARIGRARLDRAIEAERRVWRRRLLLAGYGEGWSVEVVRERGYHRTVFPGVAPIARPALITSGGS